MDLEMLSAVCSFQVITKRITIEINYSFVYKWLLSICLIAQVVVRYYLAKIYELKLLRRFRHK